MLNMENETLQFIPLLSSKLMKPNWSSDTALCLPVRDYNEIFCPVSQKSSFYGKQIRHHIVQAVTKFCSDHCFEAMTKFCLDSADLNTHVIPVTEFSSSRWLQPTAFQHVITIFYMVTTETASVNRSIFDYMDSESRLRWGLRLSFKAGSLYPQMRNG